MVSSYATGEIIEMYGKKWRMVNPDATNAGFVYSSSEVHTTRGHCADKNWIPISFEKRIKTRLTTINNRSNRDEYYKMCKV